MKASLCLFLPILILGSLLNSALADLEIKLARYGKEKEYRDVRKVVEAYVRSNTLSFPVSSRAMGGNPTGARDNYLYVEYNVDGRDFRGSAGDGSIFAFQGIAGVRPPPNLPILRPPSPAAAPLRIANRSGAPVTVYSIDRYGGWAWADRIGPGDSFSTLSQVGQDWVITDARRQVLEQYRVRAGENTVTLYPRFAPVGLDAPMRVRFENASRGSLYLYNLDRWGSWTWMAMLEPYGVYEAATRIGEEWVATDRGNSPVKQVRIAPGMTRVSLR